MTVRALDAARRARTSRHAPLYLCLIRGPCFGVRAILACCKSLIGGLYQAGGSHSDLLLPAAEPTGRRSSAIWRRVLLDDLGNIGRCGSLPSTSRRAFFSRTLVARQRGLTTGIPGAPPPTGASLSRATDLLKVQLNDFIRRLDAGLTPITCVDG
jgi:hypothetical protein